MHKCVAKQRNVEFMLSFDEWLDIWVNSGHWEDRGAGKGKYVMSRYNDVGPYALNNVFIQPFEKNVLDAIKGKKKSAEHIENWRTSFRRNQLSKVAITKLKEI